MANHGTLSRNLRVAYAICLLAGMVTHLWTLATHGLLWDYNGAPVFSRIYWSSLTVLDPAAAALLFWRPRWGLLMTGAIITSDVAHNSWLTLRADTTDWLNPMYLGQIAFFLFVLTTFRVVWSGTQEVGTTRNHRELPAPDRPVAAGNERPAHECLDRMRE